MSRLSATAFLGLVLVGLVATLPRDGVGDAASARSPGGAFDGHKPSARTAALNGSLFGIWFDDSCPTGDCDPILSAGPQTAFRELPVRSDATPCFSPDGARMAYTGARRRIILRSFAAVSQVLGPPRVIARLPRGEASGRPDCTWSPRGHSLLLMGDGGTGGRGEASVWRLNRDGSDLRKLAEIPADVGRYPGDPAWSSAGRIAFASGGRKAWLAIMDADGANIRRLNSRGHSPAWSIDGRQLAFINSAGDEYESIWPGPVMIGDADGKDVHRLRRGPYGAVAFAPDGRRMAFARSVARADADRVEITRMDGKTVRILPAMTQAIFPIRLTWTEKR